MKRGTNGPSCQLLIDLPAEHRGTEHEHANMSVGRRWSKAVGRGQKSNNRKGNVIPVEKITAAAIVLGAENDHIWAGSPSFFFDK